MNEAHFCVSGYVATQPTWRQTSNGKRNLTMRVAWTPRWQDRATGEWTDGTTSFVNVICWRKVAEHAAVCLRTGDPVLVQGRLTVRDYNDRQGLRRTAVDVQAHSIGHALTWGVGDFKRTRPATGKTAAEYAAQAGPDGESGQAPDGADSGTETMGSSGGAGLPGAAAEPGDDDLFDQEAIGALVGDGEGADDGPVDDGGAGDSGAGDREPAVTF
jgi:single-strand DNA-binding protein